jgi:hypothetical protein
MSLGYFFFWFNSPPVGQGLVIQVSRSHSDTPHSVGLLWTRDQPVANGVYLTTHNIHKIYKSLRPEEFEPAIPASERLQTRALDRAATGVGCFG